MLHSKVTRKGQTTVPGQVRSALNLAPGDRIRYDVRGDHVVIRREPGFEAVFGILEGKAKRPIADAATEREAAERAQVEHVLRKERRSR